MVVVQNDLSVIESILAKLSNNPEIEHCSFACGKKNDCHENELLVAEYSLIDKYTQIMENGLIIPRSLSVVFLNYCLKKDMIPIIYHTHGKVFRNGKYVHVDFSEQDMVFIESFTKYAHNKAIEECAFAVTDGITVEYCYVNNGYASFHWQKISEVEKDDRH